MPRDDRDLLPSGPIGVAIRVPFARLSIRTVPTDKKGHPLASVTSLAASTIQGTVEGAAFAPPAGAASVQVQAVMNDADVQATGSNTRTLQVYLGASYDNGLSFRNEAWVGWQSGPGDSMGSPTPVPGDPPGVRIPVPSPAPGLYRGSVNAPAPTYVGLTLTFYDAAGNIL